jgi:transposase
MRDAITHVGLDVHKSSISAALLRSGSTQVVEWKLANEPGEVRRLVRRLKREAQGEVLCAYEAGPCGYELQRQLVREGLQCLVVAPSLIPRKPGERIKTDRRDALKLAELLRAGMLTEVCPPTPAEEAVRSLCRAREDARIDLLRARHRLSKMLLRRGLHFAEGKAWTAKHRAWLWSLVLDHPAEKAVLDDYLLAVDQVTERLRGIDQQLAELAGQEPHRERVAWLRCFRGIDTVTAVSIVAELYGVERFARPRSLMAYLGLVPSESSSGESQRRGGITKTGNRHVRRLLVEAAHHCRHRPTLSATLRRRREGQPAAVIALADRAQQRLHRRYTRLLLGRGVPIQKVVVACARELTGFIWAALHHQAGSPHPGAAAQRQGS